MTVQAAIYARYSSDQQRDESVEDQIRLCRERAAREGWTIRQVFVDRALSGASTQRPGYQALLAAARDGVFDVVVAEALDRLSRDQEDVAGLHKRLKFAGIRLVTLAEGEVTELHVGLKGTMNALFLKDLGDKVRRGLRGRVEQGKSAGGNSYGYRVVKQLDMNGERKRGDRSIDIAEARIVVEIFQAYSSGKSPKSIALDLNRRGIPAPRGGAWSASTINGNRARGTGILNNVSYRGELAWARLRYEKDPDSGKRRSRRNPDGSVFTTTVAGHRIVSDELWNAVKARQQALERPDVAKTNGGRSGDCETDSAPFWSKQRPRYLFSGLMRCGVCGGGFSKISQLHFGCSTSRNKGETACNNRIGIRRDILEQTVLEGLRERLMDPDMFKVFVTEFTAAWNREQAEASADIAGKQSELARVKGQIERLVDALMNGSPAAAVNERLKSLEDRRLSLESDLAVAEAPAPRLHPNIAEVYRKEVSGLQAMLASNGTHEAWDLLRSLIDEIVLVPEYGKLRVEIRGALAGILSLCGISKEKGAGISPDALALQVKMVAGIGFEPMTFRL